MAAALFTALLVVPTVADAHGSVCDAKGYRPAVNGSSVTGVADNFCPQTHPETWVSAQLQSSSTGTGSWSNVGQPAYSEQDNSAYSGVATTIQPRNCAKYYRVKAVGWQWNSAAGNHNTDTDFSPNLQPTC